MGFEVELTLYCDNDCGAEEDYSDDDIDPEDLDATLELPADWVRDYDNGDTIFRFLCGTCFKEFEEGC